MLLNLDARPKSANLKHSESSLKPKEAAEGIPETPSPTRTRIRSSPRKNSRKSIITFRDFGDEPAEQSGSSSSASSNEKQTQSANSPARRTKTQDSKRGTGARGTKEVKHSKTDKGKSKLADSNDGDDYQVSACGETSEGVEGEEVDACDELAAAFEDKCVL